MVTPPQEFHGPRSGMGSPIGRRNIAYVVFVSLLLPFGMLMGAAGPQGPDSGGGITAAIILWGVVSPIFFMDWQ